MVVGVGEVRGAVQSGVAVYKHALKLALCSCDVHPPSRDLSPYSCVSLCVPHVLSS